MKLINRQMWIVIVLLLACTSSRRHHVHAMDGHGDDDASQQHSKTVDRHNQAADDNPADGQHPFLSHPIDHKAKSTADSQENNNDEKRLQHLQGDNKVDPPSKNELPLDDNDIRKEVERKEKQPLADTSVKPHPQSKDENSNEMQSKDEGFKNEQDNPSSDNKQKTAQQHDNPVDQKNAHRLDSNHASDSDGQQDQQEVQSQSKDNPKEPQSKDEGLKKVDQDQPSADNDEKKTAQYHDNPVDQKNTHRPDSNQESDDDGQRDQHKLHSQSKDNPNGQQSKDEGLKKVDQDQPSADNNEKKTAQHHDNPVDQKNTHRPDSNQASDDDGQRDQHKLHSQSKDNPNGQQSKDEGLKKVDQDKSSDDDQKETTQHHENLVDNSIRRFNPTQARSDDGQEQQPRKANNKIPPSAKEYTNTDTKSNQMKKDNSKSPPSSINAFKEGHECGRDAKRFCSSDDRNALSLLVCLQTEPRRNGQKLSSACQKKLWQYKLTLTEDQRFDHAVAAACSAAIKTTNCDKDHRSKGNTIGCLLQSRLKINNYMCIQLLLKLRMIIFTNYKFVKPLFNACREDMGTTGCGSNEVVDSFGAVSKGAVIKCLQDKNQQLSKSCRESVFNVSESQAEDFRLDRAFYSACYQDKNKFCRNVPPGKGQVYKCLMQNQNDPLMSEECKAQLRRRERLAALDYRVLYSFASSCRNDITTHKCHVHLTKEDVKPNNEVTVKKVIGLGRVIDCLTNASINGHRLEGQCRIRVFQMRRLLFSQFRLSLPLVQQCGADIVDGCDEKSLSGKENTLTCLLKIAPLGKLRPECLREVSRFMKKTNLIGDYRVSNDLFAACQPIADVACKEIVDYRRKLTCLMEKRNSNIMTADCRDHLHYILFFISRDMRVDRLLFRVCSAPVQQCGYSLRKNSDRIFSSLTFSCLYKQILHPEKSKNISNVCSSMVKKIMVQRGDDVDLHPEIQNACLSDLGKFCLNKVKHGQEIKCLQTNLKSLSSQCRRSIGNFTVLESEDIRLNENLYRTCLPAVKRYCSDVKRAPGNILRCLINNKNQVNMEKECRVEIEDFQQVRLKDFRFSVRLKSYCKTEIEENCQGMKSRSDILTCLGKLYSKGKRNSKKLSKKCRGHLHSEYFQRSEDIRLDPELYRSCENDITRFCASVQYGGAEVFECLRQNDLHLSTSCKNLLRKREVLEIKQPKIDYFLITNCKLVIMKFCKGVQSGPSMLQCLIQNKDNSVVNDRCRAAIKRRQIIVYEDYNLIPVLKTMCDKDVKLHCRKNHPSKGLAPIISCLRKLLLKHKLSGDCSTAVRHLEEAQAKEFQLDPNLRAMCYVEVSTFCPGTRPNEINICLKRNFGLIKNHNCSLEIIRIVAEEAEDIKADPDLYSKCLYDIKRHCIDELEINSQVLACLWKANKSRKKFDLQCKAELEKKAKQLSEMKEEISKGEYQQLNNLGDVVGAITESESKNYLIFVFCGIILAIFVGGLLFGRISKRLPRAQKNE
ncbi:Golgi apparatus protein 1 [Trichoplax sp. H2]|nr:Golgi apparatus protein 1 [Trichoplax sp. H2]|eukprot:RDD44111.1 Golgi apparatus protein 1 [Trichoplax sp. H2]